MSEVRFWLELVHLPTSLQLRLQLYINDAHINSHTMQQILHLMMQANVDL